MDKKIKILYVVTQGEWGGAQRYVFDLATNLGSDYDVTVAVGEPSGRHDLQTKLKSGPTVVQLKYLERNISPVKDWLAIGELAAVYAQLKPDIVHLNSSKASVIGSYAIKKIRTDLRPKIVYTAHGWVFDEPVAPWRQAVYRYLEKSTASSKSAIIVLSKHDAQRASAIGIPSEKLHLIPHGIKPLPPELALAIPDKKNFVTIANAYKTKGLDVLVQAVAAARAKLSNCRFLIIGEGPAKINLEKQVRDLGLGQTIYFLGSVPNATKFLNGAYAFVLPSRKEGLPYVILEALQTKVPIIATRVGGIPELIEDKKSGLLVNPDSVEELAQALVFAAEHPDEMKKFAAAAPTPPLLSEMVNTTSSLYSTLLLQ